MDTSVACPDCGGIYWAIREGVTVCGGCGHHDGVTPAPDPLAPLREIADAMTCEELPGGQLTDAGTCWPLYVVTEERYRPAGKGEDPHSWMDDEGHVFTGPQDEGDPYRDVLEEFPVILCSHHVEGATFLTRGAAISWVDRHKHDYHRLSWHVTSAHDKPELRAIMSALWSLRRV